MSDERVTWVEIDIDVCARRFGVAPCMAALGARFPRKCVNTFRTCGDKDNYLAEVKTLILTPRGQVGLPIAGRYFPCLISVKESEQTVNIAGSDPKLGFLGRRASVSVRVGDFVYPDRFLDPYYDERISGAAQLDGIGYEPGGSFWQALRARDPYFAGYPMRVKSGRVVNGALVTDETLHYIATEFDTNDGGAEWQGVDVLDLASNERAMVPRPSQGRLAADISEAATSLTLTPSGVGSEYGASGYVTLGREIIRYSSRSGDVLSGLTRARFNTEAKAHKAATAAQEAWQYSGKAIDALDVLFTDFGGVTSSWVPKAEWDAEAVVWFDVTVDTIVTKPMPVAKLVGEMSILGFSIYTDLAAQKIRFRANRPLFPQERAAALSITDADIVGHPKYDGRDAERLTRVEFRTVQIDPTQDLADSNFEQQHFTISANAEDPRAYGDIRYKLEKSRWLNQGASGMVRILAARYLKRFSEPPARVSVVVKRRKYGGVKLADVINLSLRALPSPWRIVENAAYQVIKRDKVNAGEIMLTLQRYDYTDTYGFWAPNDAPVYGSATEAQKDAMGFWGPNTGDSFADGRPLYKWS